MQLKATKLAAIFSRLNFALSPALALLMLVGLAAPLVAQADQWVRFTITKKKLEGLTEAQLNNYVNRNYVQLDEFGLYSAEGIQQNLGLKFANDPSAIAPGYFYLNKVNASYPTNLFLAGTVKWCYSENGTLTALEAGGTDYLVFTMHLRDDAAPVVKYNLRSGNDTATCPGRAPVCWKVETSDNGTDWVVRDEQNNQATSGYTTANNTWYNGGGSGNAPTTFYRLNRQSPGSGLPAGYTRLDWIKSTRAQHILTDYKPNAKTWMQVDCMFSGEWHDDGHRVANGTHFVCSTSNGNGQPSYNLCFGQISDQSSAVYCAAEYADSKFGKFYLAGGVGSNASRNQLTVSNGVSKLILDWTLGTSDGENTGSPKTTTCTDPLMLFGLGDKNFDSYDMTVWSWKIYESEDGSGAGANNHLVRNFIPALNPAGVPGLYDTVNQQFFGSETDVPFKCSVDGTLPSDYTRLDWIKSTRQQRIKTDYVPNARTWMEAELMLDGGFGHSQDVKSRMFRSETGADGAMYSCHVASDQSEYHRFIIYRDATSGANVSMNISPIGNDATFLLRHAFRLENGLLTWGNESYDFGTTAKGCANELYLFGSKDYNFESYYMTVYSWKIYESDNGKKGGANQTLVHDFVPALDSDGVPGLYDTVSHKFYPSITGTDFVYYQPGSLPADYTRLEYIESTVDGQQYIDVPYVKYVNDGPTKITMRGMYTTSASDYQTLCGFTTEGFCCLGIKQGTDCVGNDSIGQDIKLAKNSLDTISWELDPLNSGNGAKKEWLAVNSAVNGEASDTGTSLLVLSGTNLTIFATYAKASHEMMYFSNYKLYAMTVEQGGVVVADFVPALNSEGVPGLYDLATGQFLTNNGSGEFEYEKVSQWFRLTVTKKSGGVDDGFNFSEFALYDRAGNRQNLNLANAGSLAVLAPGQFYHDKKGGSMWGDGASDRAFDGNRGTKLGLTLASGTYTSSGEITDPQVLTLRLTNGAPEVVKYNLCSASDADNYKQRMPTAWTLEKSYDGVNWVVVDRQDETTSGWTTVNSTWYRDGGSGEVPETYFSFGDWGKEATQWFRLTIQKKYKGSDEGGLKSLQLSEFALYDANGVRQNLNLAHGESAEGLWPGEFYYDSKGAVFYSTEMPIKMFDDNSGTKMGVDFNKSNLSGLSDGDDESLWQVLTMRLTNGAPEVVKYNMCSGSDTQNYPSRAPTAWMLEKSYDGVNWTVCDVQVEATSGYTTANSTWYNNGNSYEMTEFIAVTLDGNGGLPESQVVYVGQGRPLPAIATGNLPTSDGFAFLGYFSASGVRYYNADGTGAKDCDFSENTTLYARWLEGYEPLAKLNFDGTHFILTDYIPKATTWIETEMRTNGTQITGCAALFGMAERFEGDSVDSVYGMNLSAYGSSVYGWVLGVNDSSGGKGRGWLLNDSKLVFSDKCKVRFGYFGFTLSDGSSTFEGAERPQWHKDNRFPCHTKVVIGGYNGFLPLGGEGNLGYGTPVRPYSFTSGGLDVYSFKIYESENGDPADAEQTLKHNFIPVTNTTDKVAGLYDIVGGEFYPLKTQTVVTLNPNGGNALNTNYVYATAGEAMPTVTEIPTRTGYTFKGYSAEGWEVTRMTGKETDILNEGAGIWAYSAKESYTINGVEFGDKLVTGSTAIDGGKIVLDKSFDSADSTAYDENLKNDYGKLMKNKARMGHGDYDFSLTINNLQIGASYAVQIIHHAGDARARDLSVDGETYYSSVAGTGATESQYGWSFVKRFVATQTSETIALKSTLSLIQINAIQLRKLSADASGILYYNANGSSATNYPAANGPTTLYAQWELAPTEIVGVLLAESEAVYDGSAKTPQIAAVMTASGVRLTTDDAALGWDVTYERERVATGNLTDIGNVSVVVTGKGSLSGEARANFRIYDPNKIPLPKPSLAVYKYTGFTITPSFDPSWASSGYTKSGTLSAIEKGTYTVTCTLKDGYQWENGSTMPYVVKWVIGDSFLERLANDGRNVALDSSPYAEGGDLVLHDEDLGVYIHVFTNCNNASAAFTAKENLAGVEMLLVGGGGGGGYARAGGRAGGGGAGGLVHIEGTSLAAGSYGVSVGKGGTGGVSSGETGKAAPSGANSAIRDLSGLSWLTALGGGGGGGSAWSQFLSGSGGAGAAGGCGGGNAGHCSVMEPAVGSQGGNGGVTGGDVSVGASGGGAGGNGQSWSSDKEILPGGVGLECRILDTPEWFAGGGAGGPRNAHAQTASGGRGGGGSTCFCTEYLQKKGLMNGENGLGGGGAGSMGSSGVDEFSGGRGGDGIVIIRYADPVNGLVAPVPVGKTLDYIGKTQVGVKELPGSTLSSNYYGDVEGTYTAVATLAPGYTKWSDGSTELSREIEWEIVDTKTWYLVVTDDTAVYSQSSFSSTQDTGHWNRDPNATVGMPHTKSMDYHYVVLPDKTIALISQASEGDNKFAGRSLTLEGTMLLRYAAGEKYVKEWIVQDGMIRSAESGTYKLNGETFSISDGLSLTFRYSYNGWPAAGSQTYDIKAQSIIGAGTVLIDGAIDGATDGYDSGLTLSGDASEFTGKIAMKDGAIELQNFTLTIANAFGGTIESLPSAANVTEVRFNSGANVGGLVVSSTEIPEALKTKLVVYGYDLTAADKPLVTFPAGTAVNAAEFAIKCAQNATAAGTNIGALMTVENDDNTISLYPLRVNVTLDNDGGLPATQSVRVSAGGTMPTVAELPTKDGFAFLGYFSASGVRYYNADGTGARECDFTEATTLRAKWLSTEEYTLLPSLDNGNSLDAAGYVALTNFHLTGTNVVELKYCVNAKNNDKWQDMIWSRMPDKSYSLVLRPPNHPIGCKWQVTYGEGTTSVNNYDPPTLGQDYVLRLCPTNDVNQGLLAYLDGDPVRWEIGTKKYTMFDDEAIVDTLLFAAGRTDSPVNDEPNRDGTGKMTSPALAKMYYFRVENSATDPTARLDLVPVRRTDGVRGFYDLVNGGFYPLKTPVVLDGNGGEPAQQYVYTSNGEPMPALPNNPTRTDYGFLGYYDAGTQYYDEKGMPVKACDFGEFTTTLSAHWLLTNTKARQELEEAFDSEKTGTTVEPVIVDGEIASYTVVLARNYDRGVTLPGDLGPVTIDMNGWTIRGTNGVDGATTTVGGESLAGTDGGPAITVSDASGADAGVTAITVTEVWAEYMIIDLRLSGPESVSYEVAYSFDEATNRYNRLEYKTDKIVFRKIPACTFTMGSPEDEVGRAKDKSENWRNPETQHEVTLTQDYYIGLFPVTRRQWKLVMGSCPSDADDETRPVGSVTYQMIRGSGDGIDVSKLASGGLVGEDGFLAALRAKSGLGYLDLPSEAQWECAARAGTTTSTFFGNNVQNWQPEKVSPYLWYSGNTSGHDSRGVGQVIPNPWGLYDTLGNVWEWCLDRVTCAPNDDLGMEAVTDPLRKVEGGRVPARGGKTDDNLDYSRSAARDGNSVVDRGADAATPNYGLRLAGICPTDEDNGRPAAGTSSAVIGGNGGNGYPPGKGSPAVTDTTGAKVTVTDPLTLVSDGNDGERWAYDLHVIRDEAGAPTVVVPTAWLKDANPESEVSESAYQAEFLKTNASGVVEWQAYVLGFTGAEVKAGTAKIVEETVQNANPKTVTIRLKDLPENPRTNGTCRLAYSLYAARTTAELLANGGTVVANLAEEAYYKWPESTFEAPLSDLSDENPVNYYRIKVHFIFGGGGDAGEVIYQVSGAVTADTEGWTIGGEVYSPKIDISSADAKYIQLKFKATEPCKMSRSFLYFYKTQDQSSEDASLGDGIYSGGEQEYWHTYRVPEGANWIDLGFFNTSGHTGGAAPVTLADVEIAAVSEAQAVAGAKAVSAQFDKTLLDKVMADDLAPASDPAWGRGLSGMKAALKGGASPYKVLVLTCSTLVHVQWEGLLAEQVRDRFPGANIDIDFFTQSNNDTAGRLKTALNNGLYDVTGYDCVMIHTSFLYRGDESAYKSNLAALIDACKAKKSALEIVVVSPLFTVEPRDGYFEYYTGNVDSYYTAFDSSCAAVDDYMTNGDWWKTADWPSEAESNVKNACAEKGVAYWGVYDAAYDYVWKSAKPIGWFNRSSYGFYINERGRQLNVEILLGAFQRLAACSD